MNADFSWTARPEFRPRDCRGVFARRIHLGSGHAHLNRTAVDGKGAASGDEPRLRVHTDDSGLNHAHKLREAVQAVEVHAVAAGLGEQSRAEFCAGRPEAETVQDFLQRSEELVVWNAHRPVIIRRLRAPDHALRSQTRIGLKNTFRRFKE